MTYQISDLCLDTTVEKLDELLEKGQLNVPFTTIATLQRGSILLTISLTASRVGLEETPYKSLLVKKG